MEHVPTERPNLNVLENWVDEAVMSFVVDMKYKLRLNNHKGHWKENGVNFLLEKLVNEVKELEIAIASETSSSQAEFMAIIHECADVANFAMMIADNAKRDMRGFK